MYVAYAQKMISHMLTPSELVAPVTLPVAGT